MTCARRVRARGGAGQGTAPIPIAIPNGPGQVVSSTCGGHVVSDSGATIGYGITDSATAAIQL